MTCAAQQKSVNEAQPFSIETGTKEHNEAEMIRLSGPRTSDFPLLENRLMNLSCSLIFRCRILTSTANSHSSDSACSKPDMINVTRTSDSSASAPWGVGADGGGADGGGAGEAGPVARFPPETLNMLVSSSPAARVHGVTVVTGKLYPEM